MRRFVVLYVMICVSVLYDVASFSVITLYYTGWLVGLVGFVFGFDLDCCGLVLFVVDGLTVCLCFSWVSMSGGLWCMVRLGGLGVYVCYTGVLI